MNLVLRQNQKITMSLIDQHSYYNIKSYENTFFLKTIFLNLKMKNFGANLIKNMKN